MNIPSRNSTHPDIAQALRECRRAFGSVALFSGMVNLLMLAARSICCRSTTGF